MYPREPLDPTGCCLDLKTKNRHEDIIRAFIAISLPKPVKSNLTRKQGDLKSWCNSQGVSASWPKPSSFHLTLKFFKHLPEQEVEAVFSAMQSTAADISNFNLTIKGLGVFPSRKRARVIWAGIGHETQSLNFLFETLDNKLGPFGMEPERKTYNPHITLARFKKPASPDLVAALLQDSGQFYSRPFSVKKLDLFKSELTHKRAVHTRLFRVDIPEE